MTVIGALSSFRELGEMSPHKRAAVQEIEGMIMLFAAANGGRSPWRKADVNGIPVGADLEYADEVTMLKAMEGRREL